MKTQFIGFTILTFGQQTPSEQIDHPIPKWCRMREFQKDSARSPVKHIYGFHLSQLVTTVRRLRQPNQEAAWERFVDLYAPLIFHWGKNQGLNTTDSTDLVQDVMAILVAKLPEFQYDPSKRFRGWLRTVTVNAARNLHRRESTQPSTNVDKTISQVLVTDDVGLFGEAEYRRFLVKRAMKLMRAGFQEQTWKACWNENRKSQNFPERFLGVAV